MFLPGFPRGTVLLLGRNSLALLEKPMGVFDECQAEPGLFEEGRLYTHDSEQRADISFAARTGSPSVAASRLKRTARPPNTGSIKLASSCANMCLMNAGTPCFGKRALQLSTGKRSSCCCASQANSALTVVG